MSNPPGGWCIFRLYEDLDNEFHGLSDARRLRLRECRGMKVCGHRSGAEKVTLDTRMRIYCRV